MTSYPKDLLQQAHAVYALYEKRKDEYFSLLNAMMDHLRLCQTTEVLAEYILANWIDFQLKAL